MATNRNTKKTTTSKTSNKTSKPAAKKTKESSVQNTQLASLVLFFSGVLVTLLAVVKGTSGWLFLHNIVMGLAGLCGFLLGPVMIAVAVMVSFGKLEKSRTRLVLVLLWFFMLSAVLTLFRPEISAELNFFETISHVYKEGTELHGGGVFSLILYYPLSMLGVVGARITSVLLLIVFTMIITGTSLHQLLHTAKKPIDKVVEKTNEMSMKMESRAEQRAETRQLNLNTAKKADTSKKLEESKNELLKAAGISVGDKKAKPEEKAIEAPKEAVSDSMPFDPSTIAPTVQAVKNSKKAVIDEEQQTAEIDGIIQRLATENMAQLDFSEKVEPIAEENTVQEEQLAEKEQAVPSSEVEMPQPQVEYIMPSLDLLNNPPMQDNAQPVDELKQNAQLLVDTLMSFGVSTRIIDISRGPAVTRYELQPAAGVKISKITNLADDIALNLAAAGVRIEAPIPNKAAVGIEIPNKKVSPVFIKEVIDSNEFNDSASKVTVAFGRDIAGNITVANIAKMPHVLIAGSTGSGKSVCINSLIMSILYKAKPTEVKLLMIDPKVVELGIYNGLPHLLVPVVTDPKKAAGALGWAVSEMLTRYKLFASHSVRDISGFNAMCDENPSITKMPHIVIIIDELSDLMMASPNEVEDYICRLAQMARAAGMHLVIATQRPSVDVITGTIKANIPSRVAFAVSSQIDSRTILDMGGAEKLLGMGDMLFYPTGMAKPLRVQGCYVTEKEIERVVDFIKDNANSQYDEGVIEEIEKQAAAAATKASSGSSGEGGGFDSADEELIDSAISYIIDAGNASTSMLQRKLKLGYARAARIIDELEARGIVGPFEGAKPRSVLITRERYLQMKLNKEQE